MLRMITFKEAKSILRLDEIPSTNRDIWKQQALAYGAVLNSPFSESTWAYNRLLPVNSMKQMYIITIDPNNGESTYTIKVPAGQTPSPTQPTRSGYTFNGWSPTLVPATADATYTAQWVPDVVYYTIRFLKSDGITEAYPSVQYAAGSRITPIPSQGDESDNYAATLVNPDPDMIYTPTGWGLSTNIDKKLGIQITRANGDYTFISTFNGDSRNDGNIKIFDQIGQLFNATKETPLHPSSGINKHDIYSFTVGKTGWYSMVHDGHSASGSNPDVLGADKGVSPSETERKRVYPSASDRHNVGGFYSYTGDSIIYEPFEITQNYTADHVISGFKTAESRVTSDDLLTEITFKDSNDNVVLHIKSLDPTWLKFAIIDVRGSYTNTKFLDTATYDPATYTEKLYPAQGANTLLVENIPLQAEIFYYIADNSGNARCGEIEVETPQGGDCSYVTNQANTVFDNTNNKYMTKGTVYFYQLGPNYTGKP